MNNRVSKILSFFKESDFLESTAKISYKKNLNKDGFPFHYTKVEEIEKRQDFFDISIDKKTQMFLINSKGRERGISPISYIKNGNIPKSDRDELEELVRDRVKNKSEKELDVRKEFSLTVDKNRLILAPVYIKITFIADATVFFVPVVTYDITTEKELLNNHDFRTGRFKYSINVKEDQLSYNDFVTSILAKDTLDHVFHSLEYLSDIDGFKSPREVIDNIYKGLSDKFVENELFTISMPNLDEDPAFLYFNKSHNFVLKDSYEEIGKIKSNLLEEILLQEWEPDHISSNEHFLGSMNDRFPLSEGQAEALKIIEKGKQLVVPVFGAPGTGKTNLFLSIIGNQIVKRAVSILEGKRDYNSLTLISSTSNKAIDNVLEGLDFYGYREIAFVAGNMENRRESAEKVYSFISDFEKQSHNEIVYEEAKNSLLLMVRSIDSIKKTFEGIQKVLSNHKIFDSKIYYDTIRNIFDKKEQDENKRILDYAEEVIKSDLEPVIGETSLLEVLDFFKTKDWVKIKSTMKTLEKTPIILSVFGFEKAYIKKLSLENKKFEVKDSSLFLDFFTTLELLSRNSKKYRDAYAILGSISKKMELFNLKENDEKMLQSVFKYGSFSEYSRGELYTTNSSILFFSNEFLRLHALKNKYEIIEALEILATNDFYNVDDQEKVLRNISMIYPVITSTLAGFKYLFRNFKGNTMFDKALFDEAGMIKTSEALLPLARSKSAVVVGDPKQLQPIFQMPKLFDDYLKLKTSDYGEDFFNKYSLTNASLFHLAAKISKDYFNNSGSSVVLDEHRRCQPEIAEMFLEVSSYSGISIKTIKKGLDGIHPFKNRIVQIDVKNQDSSRLINKGELDQVKNILDSFDRNQMVDIGSEVCVITPYVNQEQELIKRFGKRLNHTSKSLKIGTVHKFQGSEFKVVIFTAVVSSEDTSLSFINAGPYIINVAISRAKDLFILIGDKDRLGEDKSSRNYIGRAVRYIGLKGVTIDAETLDKIN